MRIAVVSNSARVPAPLAGRIETLVAAAVAGSSARRTAKAGDTVALVREAVASGAERIVLAGGDGTVSEAANAVRGTGTELAVIPSGSGNDYARSLGVPFEIDAAVEFALRAPAIPTDAGELVCAAHDGTQLRRIFVNIAEAGFGANVVRYAVRTLRFAPPWVAYQLAILGALATLRRARVSVSADGEAPRTVESSNLIVGIGQYFGVGMRPFPNAVVDDGLFDIAHIRDASRLDIARHAPMLKNGIPPDHPKVDLRRCRSLRAESPVAVPVEADGEWLGCLPATFTILPRALRVVRQPS